MTTIRVGIIRQEAPVLGEEDGLMDEFVDAVGFV